MNRGKTWVYNVPTQRSQLPQNRMTYFEQSAIDVCPHPLLSLDRPLLQFAAALDHDRVVLLHRLPDVLHPVAGEGRHHLDLWPPKGALSPHVLQRRRVLGLDSPGGGDQVSVALVDHDEVALLDDPPLDALEPDSIEELLTST